MIESNTSVIIEVCPNTLFTDLYLINFSKEENIGLGRSFTYNKNPE